MRKMFYLSVLCLGLVGCSSNGYIVSKTVEGSDITTATITLTKPLDDSTIDEEEYLDVFIEDLINDINFNNQASIIINDIDGTKIGSVLISKGDTVNYMFSPIGGNTISGKIEK